MNEIPQLKDIINKEVDPGSKLKIISSFFTVYGFKEIKDALASIDSVQLIINPDQYDTSGRYIETIEETPLKSELDYEGVAKEFANWLKKKVEVKKIKSKKVKGKMLSICNNEEYADYITHSDFNAIGLGSINLGGRVHINEKIEDPTHAQRFRDTFDAIWDNTQLVEDIKAKLLKELQMIYQDKSPEVLYFFTLNHLFKHFLEDVEKEQMIEKKTGITNTLIWNKLYDFQQDGVVGAINKIETYGGCIIADSVGLGKTYEALAIIKYYELRNHKVLVLAPKKLRDNWRIYKLNDKRNPFASERLFSYTLLNHTDLSRESGYSEDVDLSYVNWGNFDLVVIDESHNFRNASTGKDRMTRYEHLMKEIIRSGVKTKVLMLSATPVNKELNDIKNQIAFISEGKDDAFAENAEIESISNTLRKAQAAFNLWNKLPLNEQTTDNLLEYLNWDYFKLLDSLTIARSRKHIEKYYGLEKVGKFPTRLKPINKYCEIDIQRQFPPFGEINELIMSMNLCMYTPMSYLLSDKKEYYEDLYDTKLKGKASFKQVDREFSLKALMRTNLLKRLESSVYAFNKSIDYLIENIENIIESLDTSIADISYQNNDEYWDDDELSYNEMTIGKITKIKVSDLDKVKYKSDLEYDLIILKQIARDIKVVTPNRDEKLTELKKIIANKVQNPINTNNKKVLIFTAFADTADYLYENIANWASMELGVHSGLVTGTRDPQTTLPMKRKDFTGLLINFSPRSKERNESGEEIDLLIATDCISEGQNLQDCDYVVNYDIHWNPVRIIQRFGRIDRIGSKNEAIQLTNFWPALELEEYINLERRVKGRMKLLDISATGEENVIENSQEMRDLDYRCKQLEQMKEGVLDMEDLTGGVSITDLTLSDFRMNLVDFNDKNPGVLDALPKGIHAITRNENEDLGKEIKPGVLFCIKNISETTDKNTSTLAPFYLLYVTDDGEVLYSDKQAKQMLDIYRSLCIGKREPIKELIDQFNKISSNQTKMKHWQDLLALAKSTIKKVEDEQCGDIFTLGGLENFGAGDTNLLIADDEYELISYLVIM